MNTTVDDQEDSEDDKQSIMPAGEISFIIDEKKHCDYKLYRVLDKNSAEAVSVMMQIVRDTTTDPKLKAQVCKDIISLRNDLSTSRQKDAINRLVLESKKVMASLPRMKMLESQDDEDQIDVRVDFSMIQSCTPVDLSNVKL